MHPGATDGIKARHTDTDKVMMDWSALDSLIEPIHMDEPGGPVPMWSKTIGVSPNVQVALPGKYWRESDPRGGDFVIEVSSTRARTQAGEPWVCHRFRHVDFFTDVAIKTLRNGDYMRSMFGPAIVQVVAEGADPNDFDFRDATDMPGLESETLLTASQALALCEHRRFKKHEPLGGRCLPLRLCTAIMFGILSDGAAAQVWRKGKYELGALRQQYEQEPSLQAVLGRPLISPCCKD